jgi:FtsP/CotA-like multicopper oxidase with cupredoxin domain
LGAAAVIVIGFFAWRFLNTDTFVILNGEKELVVLIRNDKEASYRVEYQGRQPVEIQGLKVMLEGQVLHSDVQSVVLRRDGQAYPLAGDGSLPEGDSLTLQPGEAFDVVVTLRGQNRGGNYLYGFQIVYSTGENERTYRLVSDEKYAIIVQ